MVGGIIIAGSIAGGVDGGGPLGGVIGGGLVAGGDRERRDRPRRRGAAKLTGFGLGVGFCTTGGNGMEAAEDGCVTFGAVWLGGVAVEVERGPSASRVAWLRERRRGGCIDCWSPARSAESLLLTS